MPQNKTILLIILLLLVLTGAFFVMSKNNNQQPKEKESSIQSQAPTNSVDEIESVKDLIDGEYTSTPIDTTDWQTYRNEEAGFEVRIPKDWEMRNSFKEEGSSINLWFSQRGKWYSFEGGKENAIIVAISFKTNPFFNSSESTLKGWKKSYNISIKQLIVNGTPLYYYSGFGEGVKTTSSFPENYNFSLSSSLLLDSYPEVKQVLLGMIQTLQFDKK